MSQALGGVSTHRRGDYVNIPIQMGRLRDPIATPVANILPAPILRNVTTVAAPRRYTWLLCPSQPLPTATW
ncbi:hypothetical protein BCEN4_320037 [Burkholderia cenocepacia]|nr:hypothetical protein BCEN4_320037 [Burkholderia cenocepacia]